MTEKLAVSLTGRERVSRGKRWEKILRGMWTPGKYAVPSAALALSGCITSPNVVSVSPDGRYIVAPMYEDGVAITVAQPSRLVLIDTKTREVRPLGEEAAQVYWVDTAGGVVVSMQANESLEVVVVDPEGKPKTIKDAMFPTLSNDGKQVVYVSKPEGNPNSWADQVHGRLMRFDLAAGKTHDLKIDGTMPDISPNGERVLFVAKLNGQWHAAVASVDGSDMRRIAEIDADAAGNVFPRWIDDQSFLFRTAAKDAGDDSELYVASLMGDLERVTDNEVDDVFPQTAGPNRILYLVYPRKFNKALWTEDKDFMEGELWISEKRDGKWGDRTLGIKAHSFRVFGEEILYVAPNKEKSSYDLIRAPLDNPKQSIDTTKWIREKVKDLPKSK